MLEFQTMKITFLSWAWVAAVVCLLVVSACGDDNMLPVTRTPTAETGSEDGDGDGSTGDTGSVVACTGMTGTYNCEACSFGGGDTDVSFSISEEGSSLNYIFNGNVYALTGNCPNFETAVEMSDETYNINLVYEGYGEITKEVEGEGECDCQRSTTEDLCGEMADSSFCETAENTFNSGLSDTMVFSGSSSPFGMTWSPTYSNCSASCDLNQVTITCSVLGTLAPTLSRSGSAIRLVSEDILITDLGTTVDLVYEKCD